MDSISLGLNAEAIETLTRATTVLCKVPIRICGWVRRSDALRCRIELRQPLAANDLTNGKALTSTGKWLDFTETQNDIKEAADELSCSEAETQGS